MFLPYFSILSLCLLATDASAKKESLRRNLGSPKQVACTPYQVLGAAEGQDEEISKWVCETRAEDEWSRTPLVYDIEGLDHSYFENEGIVSGKDSITMALATKSRGVGKMPYAITVQPGSGVMINRGHGRGNKGRRLAATTGLRKVLVVRVSSPDSTPERTATDLSNDCFGIGVFADTVQLKSQFNACSGGKFQPGPAANNATAGIIDGVVDVTISINAINAISYNTVENAARVAATEQVGELTQWDHVMFTWTQYSDWAGAAAYAYVGGDVSCYQDTRIWQMGVQVHELGHNLGLWHSGEITTYDDWTCMMGNPSFADDQHKMCFNGVKSWLLGWYSDRHWTFDPLTGGNLVGTKMAALDDYLSGKTTSAHSVVLMIVTDSTEDDDYYVMYNRAKGVNAEVRQYPNEVTITKGRDGAVSSLVGHLAASNQVHTLQVSGKSMKVKLCRFDTDTTGTEYALINVYDGSLSVPSCPAVICGFRTKTICQNTAGCKWSPSKGKCV